ncbi:MAG: ankyrin repeat domain-containing protein, partial [Bacteroidota bacterium]
MMINAENMFLHIQKRENEVLKDFLSKNGIETTDPEGRTALINAAFYNNIDLLEWLINQEADINAKDYIGYTALHFACQEGHIDSVKLLLLNNA